MLLASDLAVKVGLFSFIDRVVLSFTCHEKSLETSSSMLPERLLLGPCDSFNTMFPDTSTALIEGSSISILLCADTLNVSMDKAAIIRIFLINIVFVFNRSIAFDIFCSCLSQTVVVAKEQIFVFVV